MTAFGERQREQVAAYNEMSDADILAPSHRRVTSADAPYSLFKRGLKDVYTIPLPKDEPPKVGDLGACVDTDDVFVIDEVDSRPLEYDAGLEDLQHEFLVRVRSAKDLFIHK